MESSQNCCDGRIPDARDEHAAQKAARINCAPASAEEWFVALDRIGRRYSRDTEEHRTIREAVAAFWELHAQHAKLTGRYGASVSDATLLRHRIELARTALGLSA